VCVVAWTRASERTSLTAELVGDELVGGLHALGVLHVAIEREEVLVVIVMVIVMVMVMGVIG
jgi:hypothetical protein